MRRALAFTIVILAVSSCAAQERPEGIVERWLLALNQGAAGQPHRYAPSSASDEVLPDWEHLDPGELDVVEVASTGTARGETCDGGALPVPFRVVRLDGSELRSIACVGGSRVTQLRGEVGFTGRIFPSEGGPATRDERASVWGIAIGVGFALVITGEGLMRLVRHRRPG